MAYINAIIFLALSILHFYWVLGGKYGENVAVPTKKKSNDKIFTPSALSTVVVAIGLSLFGLIELGNTGIFLNILELKYFQWGNLLIAFIFLTRTVGDFNYVGLFKRVRNTSFARNDSRYYSPLCFYLAATSLYIVI